MSSRTGPYICTWLHVLGKEAVDNWYSEIKDYNFSKPGFASNTSTLLLHIFWKMCGLRSCVQNANYVELKQKAFNHIGFNKAKTQRGRFNHNLMYCGISPIGHFTQVVWKESTEVGVGLGINGETVFVVGQYNTAGNMNMEGYFIDNVLPEGNWMSIQNQWSTPELNITMPFMLCYRCYGKESWGKCRYACCSCT